jgi:hypothetical protein
VFPRQYVVYNTIGVLFCVVSVMIAVFEGGYSNTTCKSHTEAANGNKGSCTLMHWFLYVGAWISNSCFMIISLNILLIFLSKFRKLQLQSYVWRLHIAFHAFIFVPPVVIMTVEQAVGNAGYGRGIGACIFKSMPIGESGVDAANLFFLLLPFSCTVVLGYAIIAATIYCVIKYAGVNRLRQELLFLAFPLLYGIPQALSLVPAWVVAVNSGSTQAPDYIECKVNNWITSLFEPYEPVVYQKCIIENGVGRTDYFNFVYGTSILNIHFVLLVIFFFGKDVYRELRKARVVSLAPVSDNRALKNITITNPKGKLTNSSGSDTLGSGSNGSQSVEG